MLLLNKAIFLHVPKTGGIWVYNAIMNAGIQFTRHFDENGSQHIVLRDARRLSTSRMVFAFVRHPLEWWRSYWQYKCGVNWHRNTPNHNAIDRLCGSYDLNEFALRVVEHFPGYCGTVFDEYVGTVGNEIEYIGRQENLVEDLIEALNIAGEVYDEKKVRLVAPKNVSNKNAFSGEYSEDIAAALAKAEGVAMSRFGYK